MANSQYEYGDPNNKNNGYGPDDGGGAYSGGTGVALTKDGHIDPNYHPPTRPGSGSGGLGPSAFGGGGDPYSGIPDATGTGGLGGGAQPLAGSGVAGANSAASSSVWQNILSAVGSGSAGGYAAALRTYGPYIMALISAVTGSKGKFQQQPESPELTATRNKQMGFVDNSPTRDMYAGLLQSFLGNGGVGAWKAPAPMAGGQFYQGGGTGGGANDVIAAYLKQVSSGLTPQPAASPAPGSFVPERDKLPGGGPLVP